MDLQTYSSPYSCTSPCSRSICIQYLLRHRHLQNVFELPQSQRPFECTPRLPLASLSTEHAAGSAIATYKRGTACGTQYSVHSCALVHEDASRHSFEGPR